jgi:hypothetical protein
MDSTSKPSVLFVYFTCANRTQKVIDAMAEVLRGRGRPAKIAIPDVVTERDYGLVCIGSPTWWRLSTDVPVRSFLQSDTTGRVPADQHPGLSPKGAEIRGRAGIPSGGQRAGDVGHHMNIASVLPMTLVMAARSRPYQQYFCHQRQMDGQLRCIHPRSCDLDHGFSSQLHFLSPIS